MFQKMFDHLDIDNSWLGRLAAMIVVSTVYATPYIIMNIVGMKSGYKLSNFIAINNIYSFAALLMTVPFSIYIAHHLTKPQNIAEWKILIKKNLVAKNPFTLNNFLVAISEEFIFRYILFFSLATLLGTLKAPEIVTVLIFVTVSSHLFSKTHKWSKNKTYYYYYYIAGILLSLTFLLSGLVWSIFVHFIYNLTADLTENYYISHPTY